MAYTVKQLANASGVSVRTLHHYDAIGLLKPAHCGDNKYRYYGETELLRLQQILFYRRLGLSLDDIQQLLDDPNFNKLAALKSHKNRLEADLLKIQTLIHTIDKTINHIGGNRMTKLEDIFDGFTDQRQNEYVNFLVNQGVNEEKIRNATQKTKDWSNEQWLAHKQATDEVHEDLVNAIYAGLKPESIEVQAVIRRHYELTNVFWTPDRKSYVALWELYGSHPDFVEFYRKQHPDLLNFMGKAMTYFAETELS